MARFSLKPTPEPVRNAFVPIRFLQRSLKLEGRANVLLVAGAKPSLQDDLHKQLTLDDWGLRYRSPKDRAEAFFRLLAAKSTEPKLKSFRWEGRLPEELEKTVQSTGSGLTKEHLIAYYQEFRDYGSLESERMMLEPFVVKAIEKISGLGRWRTTPILIYLADTISDGTNAVPYSIIAGREVPFLKDEQILLTSWKGSPLQVHAGSAVTLTYFVPDERNQLVKKTAAFTLMKDPEPIQGARVLDDPDYTPEVPGVTDKLDITDWENPPFPYEPKRNTKADIAFSKRYRTTPRAYITLKRAQALWGNRFGDLTSIRIQTGSELADKFPQALLQELKPEQGGFVFQKVREQALTASSGTVDFGEYFLYFSFFLIVSALLLVGLLMRLNIDRRASEMGLLLATGWDHGRVRWLLLSEGIVLTVVGGFVGLAGALLYARLMLQMLSANWPGGASLNFLGLHVGAGSLAIGYSASLAVSLLTLWWATRVLGKLTPRALLSGETTQSVGVADARPGWSRWLILVGVAGALALAVSARFISSPGAQAGCFFGGGALLLVACLAGTWNVLKRMNHASSPQPTLTRLGIRNAGRHAVRSVLTVGLLAAASFLIVAVESFHKEADHHFLDKTGGSGGFAFFAEGSVPVFETPALPGATFYPCRVQPGDDASCLNLYKPLKPRILGVSDRFLQRGGFHFSASEAKSDNPWLLLQSSDDVIPAIIDATTAQYTLKLSLGAVAHLNKRTGEIVAEAGDETVKLRIVGLLSESIFQSEILISEANFLKLYPQQTGFSFFLIEADTTDPAALKALEEKLSKSLENQNLDVATTASRLQGYLAVENMYLATFQALGGLGLVLGAAGLAIVLLRGVWERRAELALLQALGFRAGQLAWLVLAENAFLLVLGLAAGTASALLAVAPHLVGSGAQVLWLRIAALLALVLAVGMLSAALAVWSTLKTPVLTALRRE
jgi:ABC-type antimicrobial peptide transport system permease subunit